MREIKFRVWHKGRKKYYQVHHLHLDTIGFSDSPKEWATCKAFDCIENKEIYIQVQPKDAILEQYTGLKDKNGKEIYEGDKNDSGYVVKYSLRATGFIWHKPIGGNNAFTKKISSVDEIIGNIHEEERQ